MKTKNYSLYAVFAVVLLLTSALITSCVDPVNQGGSTVPTVKEPSGPVPPDGMGYIKLNVNVDSFGSRTIIPGTTGYDDKTDFDEFDIFYTATTPGYTEADENEDYTYFDTPKSLVVGIYTITVIASDGGVAKAAGTATGVSITTAGETVNITLKEIVDGTGTGTFTWSFSNTGDYDVADLDITNISPNGTSNFATVDLLGDDGDSPPVPNSSGTATLKSGYYRVEITLEADGYESMKVIDVLHIYEGFDSVYPSNTLPALRVNSYTVNFVTNAGTVYTIANQTISHGGTVTAPTAPTLTPTATDHPLYGTFEGWYITSGFTGSLYNFSTPVIRDFTLYAKWTGVSRGDADLSGINVGYTAIHNPSLSSSESSYFIYEDAPHWYDSVAVEYKPLAEIVFTLTDASPQYTAIQWYNDGVPVAADVGSNDLEYTLDLSNVKYTQLGDFTITVIVTYNGIPYDASITIEVEDAP